MNATEAGDALALLNATLNATSAMALFTGFYFIRRRVIDRHRRSMLTALGASALFLVFYVIRVLLTGTHEFAGEGFARTLYFAVLFSHMILAVGVLSLASSTGQIVRQITLGDLMTERSVAFQTTIDRLQSLPYDNVLDGTGQVGIYRVRWRVFPQGPQSKIVRIWTRGPGLGDAAGSNNPVAVDSFDIRILRR